MSWAKVLLLASITLPIALAGDGPRLLLSRSFPGSVPPYIQVTIDKSGNVEYSEAADDDSPFKYKLGAADTEGIFGLAEKLDYFKRPLESPVKVAFMGTKTFRYEDGSQKTEVKFNFSTEPAAQTLIEWFERMAETAQDRINLERAVKYDHLGVMKALNALGESLDRGRLAGPEQFLPLLDRLAASEVYMHTARARAAEIAETIRTPKK